MDDLMTRRRVTRLIARRCRRANVEIIVGIAGPSMVWSCWVAQTLSLPAAYLREPKDYGRQRNIEGASTKDRRVALITDGHNAALYITHLQAASVKLIDLGKYF